jgi:hypothetical protein
MIRKKYFTSLLFLLASASTFAQVGFQQRTATAGRINLTLSNAGTIGRPTVRSNTQGAPSMSFPQKGKEHLFESGIWIGAVVNGQKLVSTSAFDASNGYSTGGSGFEFSPEAVPVERSKKTSSPNYSPKTVSDQDIIFNFSDKNTIVPGTSIPISGHVNPLGASVKLETYSWSSSYADFFVICNYEITNNSTTRWDDVWLGQWADLVVRNVNVTRESGTAFYNKGRNGVDTKYKSIYAYLSDNGADDANYISSFGAMQFLGISYRGLFFNPDKPDTFLSRGWPSPVVNYNFWNFTAVTPEYSKPGDDLGRYDRMTIGVDSATLYNSNGPVNGQPNNWIQLLSAGPLISVEPGEKFNYTVAYVCANNSQKTVQGGYVVATPESRKELTENSARTRSTYLGENINEDGKYNPDLDLNSNGILDQYIVPEAPATPTTKIIASDTKVEIYWDGSSIESIDPISRKKDFEGYRIYRTNVGDDLNQSISDNQNLVAQWDSVGNDVGYNNGFTPIRLSSPIKFDGAPTEYWFKYEMDNLQNGWQYLFVVTAFDEGDKNLGIESLESSSTENATSVYAGTTPKAIEEGKTSIGVYPNPYKTTSAWDGSSSRTHKIYFYNLPAKCDIHIYTSSGDLVATLNHDASTYQGEDSQWFDTYSTNQNKVFSGGEHAWDILSNSKTTLSTGVYIFTVKDSKTGNVETGKFTIIK